jgi:hypothetical protein
MKKEAKGLEKSGLKIKSKIIVVRLGPPLNRPLALYIYGVGRSCPVRKSFTTRILLGFFNLVRTHGGCGLTGPGWRLDRLAYRQTGYRAPRLDRLWNPVWPACPVWFGLCAIFACQHYYSQIHAISHRKSVEDINRWSGGWWHGL